jgi:hypothetical protein
MMILASGACATKGNLKTQASPVVNKIAVSGIDVLIVDKRSGVRDGGLKIPVLTLPGEPRRISPAISLDLEETFKRVLERFRTEGKTDVVFKIEITEGLMSFQAKALHEVEHVSTRLRLTVTDPVSGADLGSSTGVGWGTRKSLDASPARLEEMFNLSIEAAMADALSNLRIHDVKAERS